MYSSSFKSFFPFKGRYRIQYEDVQDKDSVYFTTFLSCYPANITFIDKRCGNKITLDDDNTYEFSIALGVKNQHSAGKKTADYNLTSKEKKVLNLIKSGNTNNEIAKKLNISVNTTKVHVCSILQKLEVDDRTQAAIKAIKYDIV